MCIKCKRFSYKKPERKRKPVKAKRRKATGEGELFKYIWDNTPQELRVSFVTGNPLPSTEEAYSYYFSHVLKKGSYKWFRLNIENIVFMTLEEHDLWEHHQYKIINDPKWDHVFKLKDKLINEYANVFGSGTGCIDVDKYNDLLRIREGHSVYSRYNHYGSNTNVNL